MFKERYASAFGGDERWQSVPTTNTVTYSWDPASLRINTAYRSEIDLVLDRRQLGLCRDFDGQMAARWLTMLRRVFMP
jgi:hypothetical protein